MTLIVMIDVKHLGALLLLVSVVIGLALAAREDYRVTGRPPIVPAVLTLMAAGLVLLWILTGMNALIVPWPWL